MERTLDSLHAAARRSRLLRLLAPATRVLLALAFLPSGLTKTLGRRFTTLSPETQVGALFEVLYQSGLYWRFIGISQLLAAVLLVIPRTSTLGAFVYLPLAINIFMITVSFHFRGTPYITGGMLLGSVFLLCWDYDRWKTILFARRA